MFRPKTNSAPTPGMYRVIYRSPYGGGTEISELATRDQCMATFSIALSRGWLRQDTGRSMVVISDAEYLRRDGRDTR